MGVACLLHIDFQQPNGPELEAGDGFSGLSGVGAALGHHFQCCCNLVIHLEHLVIIEVFFIAGSRTTGTLYT